MSDAVVLGLFLALVWKFTDFLKHVSAKDWNGVVTQVLAWAAAFVALVLFAHSAYGGHLVIHGLRFDHVSWTDQLLAALMIGSAGSVGYDFKKALDQTDSAAVPRLLPTKRKTRVTPPRA